MIWILAALLAYVVLSSLWIGIRGFQAKGELESVQTAVTTLRDQVSSLDVGQMQRAAEEASSHANAAVSLTSDPIWRIAEYVPFLGANLTAVREVAEIGQITTDRVVRPLISVAVAVDPSSFAPKDGAIDLAPFANAAEPIGQATAALSAATTLAHDIPSAGVIGPVADARAKVIDLLSKVQPPLSTLNTVVPLLPQVMGADGPRLYAVMFQNPAEPRALGGAALSFTLIEVDHGKISIKETLPASTGAFTKYSEPVIPIPDGAQDVYPDGGLGIFIAEATARPSFTTAGQMVAATWQREFGESLDGVLSIDPIALSYVLRATGPIPLATGDVLDETNLVPMLLNGIYLRYAADEPKVANAHHDAFFAEVVSAVFARITSGNLDAARLVRVLAEGWDQRRILFWSAHSDVESALSIVGLNGEMPVTDDKAVRAGLYLQDSVGSKLSFYLRQGVTLSHATCSDGRTYYRVQLTLRNTMDPAAARTLPFHITGEWAIVGTKPGVNRLTVRLYAPPGSTITGASVDGAAVELPTLHDETYPVGKTVVEVAPGERINLDYVFALDGDASRSFDAQITPLVQPTPVDTVPLECAAVGH